MEGGRHCGVLFQRHGTDVAVLVVGVFANEIDSARGHDQDVGLAAIGLREESAGLFGHAGVHGWTFVD